MLLKRAPVSLLFILYSCICIQVTKQLFEPLLMQLIHWFTNNKKAESEETMVLLDAIYEGIIQPTDTALRDFSAMCLKEFLQWSIKQTKNVERSPVNAKSVLKRLYSYALHPGAFKRLGAAVAFNNIYTVFREDNTLVNLYTFQILVYFVESLAIAHKDEVSLGTQDQCKKALEHVERIIKVKKDILKVENKARTEPKHWSVVKLDIGVRWLLRQCGRPQTECRHTCMKLVHEFAPLIAGVKSTQNYFQIFYKKEKGKYFITRFEGNEKVSKEKSGIANCPVLTDIDQRFSFHSILSWFDMVLAPLDCYSWVFGQDLITSVDMFAGDGIKQTKIFKSIQYFVENIAMSDLSSVANLFDGRTKTEFFTPREIEEFNKVKCTVTVRVLYFLAVLLGKSKGNAFKMIPAEMWNTDLWRLICLCVIEPVSVGFNIGDIEVMKNLPHEMEKLLKILSTAGILSAKVLGNMQKEFANCLQGERDLAVQIKRPLSDCNVDSVKLQQLVTGYDIMKRVGILGNVVSNAAALKENIMNHVLQGLTESVDGTLTAVSLSPTVLSSAKSLLNLAFHLGFPAKKLVETILSTCPVQSSTKGYSQCLGELFFSTFQTVVVAQLVDTAGDVMPLLADQAMKNGRRISSVVVSMVDHVSRDKELRKTMGSNLVSSILGQWKQFSGWWDINTSIDLHSMALLLLTKMVLLDSKFVSNPAHPHFKDVFTMYQKILTNNKTNLAFKTRVLDLLPFFAMLPEPHSKTLKGSLDRLVADNFPLKSWEFEAESPQYKDYTAAIDRILNGLELSGSLMLLELLISVFCREPTHQYEAPILESINRFTKRLSLDKQKAAVDVAYDIFTQLSFPAEVRVTTIDKVALPMLRLVQKTALIQFFCNHIGEMRTTLENKLVKGSDQENQLVAKSCTYKLLEVMYCRLEKDEVFSKSSAVNDRFCSVKGIKAESGKEMTQVIMKNAHEAKGEDVRGETSLLEQRRQYHCTAYNLLIAILSCTQTEAKFYAVFLFQENEAKGNFVFDNLVDKEKVYEFPSELKAPLARKKQYVSIRNEVKSERVSDSDENYEYSASIHLASQYLADSSLSEDFNQYDFSATSQLSGGSPRDKSSKLQVVRKSSYTDIDDDSDTKVTVEGDYVELEMDDLNQHECMAAMIALLKHMQRTKIIPPVESGIVPEMPLWMKHLHEKLKNSRTHTNVKYFIGKLIVNTPEIFRPYAKYWLKPLCLLILDSSFSSINYYLIDVVVTMMSWHKVAIPEDSVEEKAMATRLTEFLTAHVYSETRAVYRNNLDLVKTLMTVWKSRIDVPYHIIYKQLKQSDVGKKEGSIGIHVLGLVLSCDLPPYGPVAPVDEEKYLAAVVQYCTHDYKTVYSAAAEVVGLILKYMAVKDKVTDGSFHSYVVQLLGSIQQAKPDNFVISVDRMHRHYAPIADRFMNKMLFLLPKLHGEFLSVCLKVILSRVETIENVFVELKSKGLMSFLTHREEETQLTSLKIVQAISAKLKPSELLSILSVIAVISISPSVACRNVMYDILMWVYDNYREEDNEEGHKIMQLTKENLLKGLGDEELQCRLLVQNFWSSETRLPSNTSDRLVAMLEAMYSPITEQQFLSYATNLVLEMTSKSPDYLREIFEHPLEECRFQDYSVKSSWRQRHAVMTPLFASTMASQTADMDISMADDTTDGQIRATIDAQQFSATQDASRAPFNWLTGSSLDTYTDYSTVGSEAPSSLLFTVGTADMAARLSMKPGLKPRFAPTRPKPGTSKEKPGENTKKKADDFESNEMSRLKRRFLRDQEKTRVFFAKQNYRIQKMRKVVQEEQKTRRENQVTMYRKYRKGDLPDIQIKYSYIIAPLQAVAHRDSTIAKLLFGAIFKAIFAKLDEVKTEREVQQTIQEISTSINTILSGSTQYFPPFISCILDILYELRTKLDVDISNVGTAAVVSNLQPLGICVLEEQLIHQNAGEARPAKRGRTEGMNISEDVSSWIELSRLYKSVNEYDVLQGIFSNKIGTQEITKDAVTLEARGDYHGARKLYEKALSEEDWEDGKPLDIELDMWDDCRMECLDHLAQWKPLEEISTSAVENGNISRVWEDTFYQEHYLPYIIRSKVKLMLQGDEEQQSLLKFIDASMKMSEPKSFLESRYCEELAMMYIWQSDYDRARHYVSMAMEKFQQEWSSTDTLMLNSRTSQLQKLQPLVEMQEFLNFMSHESNFTTILPAKRLLNKWESKSLHPLLDPVSIWDDLVTNRNVFLDHICSHVSSVKTEDSMDIDSQSDDVYNEFLESKVRLKLQMVESCCYTNNNKLALTLLASTKDQCKETGSYVVNVDWSHLYTLTHQTKAMAPEASWSDELFTSILSTLDRLGKYDKKEVLKRESGLGRRHFSLSGNSFKLLALGVHSVTHLEDLNVKVKDKFTELTGVKKYKKDEMIDQLVQLGYSRIKCSLSYEDHSSKAYRYGMEEAYLSVAKYCDQFLHMQEDEEIKFSEKTVKEFPESIVTCLLNAVKLDSMEARQRFPRLLQLVELYPDTMALFIKKCDEVPSWMFIMWIGQMMALLDRPEAPAVHNIIIQLVKEYPQAVVYPYHLSSEGYKFGNSPKDKRNKEFVEKLSSMLGEEKLPLVCKFISALDNLSQPDQTFKDWADDMKIKLNKQKADKEELVTDFMDMYKKLLEQGAVRRPSPSQEDSLSDSPSIVEKGKYSRKFADRFKKDIESGFGKDGKKLIDMTYNSFSKVFSKIYNDMQEEIKGFGGGKRGDGPLLPPKSLKDYCQWLSEFNPNVQGRDLEIPGQYDGLSKPMPEYHTKIAGFDQRVLVMTSIRKPKRITIRGNDEREYNYLVKGGEDLRQDQRIEQLFYIMNQVFDKDPACKQRKLRLKTYQVVPLTTRVGLIEWMNNTMPLKDFLLSNFTEDELKHFRGKQGPAFLHHNWIMKLHKQQATAYHEMYRKCSRTEVKREFQQKEGKVPWDLCRRAFQKMSSSPEAFHVLRCKFAVTHALISTCQYILGIGDRHLSNFMINLNNGEMVGIDFGHAFGSATQFLPIPELMPLRLTRQIRNIMMPLQVKGLIESTMVHSLRALRNDCDLLLNTMDIFVKEPSVDWIVNAEKQIVETNVEEDLYEDGDISWYPKEKVAYVKRKLRGENPCYITRDELRLGHKKKSSYKSLESVLMGEKKEDRRAQLPQYNLSVEQQVEALIDQATDTNILGRVYAGWEPWM